MPMCRDRREYRLHDMFTARSPRFVKQEDNDTRANM